MDRFPPYINCIPKDLPSNVMVNVAVFSSDPFIRTCFEFLLAHFLSVVDTGNYLEKVGSKFRVRLSGMLCFSTFQRFDCKKQVRLL